MQVLKVSSKTSLFHSSISHELTKYMYMVQYVTIGYCSQRASEVERKPKPRWKLPMMLKQWVSEENLFRSGWNLKIVMTCFNKTIKLYDISSLKIF